jgi:branched-chain amino acid transport system permease protein
MGDRLRRLFVRLWPLIALLAITAATAQIQYLGGQLLQRKVQLALIYLLLVVALYMFTGNSGVFSFGTVSFMAIGAYTTALLTIPPKIKHDAFYLLPQFIQRANWPTTAAIVFGGLLAAGFGLVLSLPLMRLSGIAASLATFAVLNIVYLVGNNWTGITNGSEGLEGVPQNTTVDTTLVWSLVAITAAYVLQISRYGVRLRASREDYRAARSIGIGVHGERRLGFVVSAFFAGIAGGLFAQYIGSFNASAFYLDITFLTVVMLVVGGVTSLAGAVLGSIFISFVSEFLYSIENGFNIGSMHVPGRSGLREVILAVIMLAILILRPRGITGGRELGWLFSSQRRGRLERSPAAPEVEVEAPPAEAR